MLKNCGACRIAGVMKIYIVTLFPEMFEGIFDHSMLLKARKQNIINIDLINLRDFGLGPRKTVDDTPYGGGDGMLLKPEPIFEAVEHIKSTSPQAKVILMTPRGQRLNQALVRQLSEQISEMIIICGRYEGYDERITELVDYQVSIGDYVLTGGEIPAMALVDSVVRLLPGVLGGETSAINESFTDEETLEYPQYTRPAEFRGHKVPDVLLSGNHAQIAKWRKLNSKKTSK